MKFDNNVVMNVWNKLAVAPDYEDERRVIKEELETAFKLGEASTRIRAEGILDHRADILRSANRKKTASELEMAMLEIRNMETVIE